MPEYVASTAQTVAARDNVLFTDTPVPCTKGLVVHREGSGIVTLKGCTPNCNARYFVAFSGNVALPAAAATTPTTTAATPSADTPQTAAVVPTGTIGIAIAVDGEPLQGATALSTPASAGQYNNVATFAYVNVPRGCCTQIAVENTGTEAINVQNANLLVTRVA